MWILTMPPGANGTKLGIPHTGPHVPLRCKPNDWRDFGIPELPAAGPGTNF
jgi:hypothetical protein